MQERYNDESPELRDAREQLQALVKRGLDEFQVEPEQKSAEPKGPSYIDSLESVGFHKAFRGRSDRSQNLRVSPPITFAR